MKWWICEGKVICPATDTGKPSNFAEVEGEEGEIGEVYFDGTSVVRKPPRPSVAHFWIEDKWQTPFTITEEVEVLNSSQEMGTPAPEKKVRKPRTPVAEQG